MKKQLSIQEYQTGLKAGDRAILSRAITLIESRKQEHQVLAAQLMDSILPNTGDSVRIGITGVPGVGKSTFIEVFGMHLIAKGKKVAVLAIDPSSSLTRGSILGDKTRMERLSVHPNAFIRPSAAAGSLGGVTYKTREAMLLCEAAGFDTILIETVGVGQSETEVSRICDFFLLLMLAGAGDELQGIKRGIMEMADGLIITKADGQNLNEARTARTEYARALHFLPPQPSGWRPEVNICSAYDGYGIEDAWQMVEKYIRHQTANGYFQQKRQEQHLNTFRQLLQEQLQLLFLKKPGLAESIRNLEQQVQQQQLNPYSAVRILSRQFLDQSDY